ncbi:UDP-N-acetylmuramoyl-L-alanine--D-glutamate ligase [bacterium]|nr:UDP-N-acetylmuramoyl-L-alanine--D-glutamate ligase [bacterium]
MSSPLYSEDELAGKLVWVIGMGRSGIAAARLLKELGADVLVTEKKRAEEVQPYVAQLDELEIDYETGGHRGGDGRMPDFAVVSPGVPTSAPILEWLVDHGRQVVSEVELASWFYYGTVIGVTGSNGKTTTVSWITHILREAGLYAVSTGNIGYPFCDMVLDHVKASHAVVEVSSYQLESILSFKPHVSLLTNLSPDHLERHGSMEAYARAKANIFKNQDEGDFAVLPSTNGLIAMVSTTIRPQKLYVRLDRCPDLGAGFEEGNLVMNIGAGREVLLSAGELPLPGLHNIANALMAAITCRLLMVPTEAIVRGLRSFPGVPHRLEKVKMNGRVWVNDSKSTNIDSLRVALESVDESEDVWLIAGGQDKGAPYGPLRELVGQKVRKLLLIGETAPMLMKAWGETVSAEVCGTLDKAVERADKEAPHGTTILLSPACASFDQFKNFEHRGEVFKQLIGAGVKV